ncbi:hypothetical protein [Chryseobacterium shigense]|uniref:ABC-type transport system involved in multi-copper enzyme maturation permease subunit n=1 Tax=Chryseobacterium shigense TaxID=297244 RepID=A0A841NAN2_9FLAO|nr:hypothetical protein [Chryseobacterium shigense]MBB6372093.1 ABC-type transport system involved in multi-copper enzyme maturation permease subunit [Chryseobacterium shigense]
MKNVLLKSLAVFVVMSFLNTQLAYWSGEFIKLPGGKFGMLSTAVLVGSLIITVIALITVAIFKGSYNSIWKMAVLFEILYLLMLMLSGASPVTYFTDNTDYHLIDLLLYLNSMVICVVVCLFDVIYSRILSTKVKN